MTDSQKKLLSLNLYKLINADTSESVILLTLAGFAVACGFMYADDFVNPNYQLILQFGGHLFWSAYFFTYSVLRVVLYTIYRNKFLCYSNHLMGLWGWTYLFISFVIYDPTPTAPTEYLLVLPVLTEFWLFLRTVLRR